MGMIINRTLIVTSSDQVIERLAESIGEDSCEVRYANNGVASLSILPCGSKEGWETCEEHKCSINGAIKYCQDLVTELDDWAEAFLVVCGETTPKVTYHAFSKNSQTIKVLT